MTEWAIALAILGGSLAVSACGVGSSIGIGMAGSAGAGIISEEPEKFSKVMLLEFLPGTQGFYGFIVFFLVLNTIGLLGGTPKDLRVDQAWQIFFATLPMTIAGFMSAIHQGRVAAAGMSVVAKQPEHVSRAMLLSVMVETYAVLALLASFLMLSNLGI